MNYDFTEGRINVLKYGAKGDGITDDTDAIQAAINAVCARGGGTVFFPYTPTGYRIAKPAREEVDGKPCRAQLYIPWAPESRPNISFQGEHPCKLLYSYGIERVTGWQLQTPNTFLFSDWDAPEEHDETAMPWSLIGCLKGDSFAGKFGPGLVSIINLEFRVKLNPEKMYPTMSAANLQHSARCIVRDSQFCLDRNIGVASEGKILQENPCHTSGLIMSATQNDDQILDNVSVQGFRYGFILNEHLMAGHLYVHNCENGLVFTGMSHQSMISLVTAQCNRRVVCAAPKGLYGNTWWDGCAFIEIGCISYETGRANVDSWSMNPPCNHMEFGVWDPEDKLYGSVGYHSGWPLFEEFKVKGGRHCRVYNKCPEFQEVIAGIYEEQIARQRREIAELKKQLEETRGR